MADKTSISMTRAEWEDVLLVIERSADMDTLKNEFCLIDDQDEDMYENLMSAELAIKTALG